MWLMAENEKKMLTYEIKECKITNFYASALHQG